MTRYDFYNNLELFHKTKEIIQQEEQEKIQEDLNELKHYGTKGQKWGVRKWQNYDGTFNEAGKERYFGKSSGSSSTDEEKVGSVKSDVKSYLKFRNKMLRQRTDRDLKNKYLEEIKDSDKQLLKDAKKVDKQREKMYKNQLKEHYDDPNELVRDLDMMYKIGNQNDKVGGLFNKKAINENGQEYNPKYQNRDGSLTLEGHQLSEKKASKKINSEMLEDYKNKKFEREEQERIEQEAKENKVKEILNDARSDVKIKKELQNKDISDKELENIINDIDSYSSWKYWDELEKNNKNEFNKIADLGLDALARSSKYYSSDDDIGDDGWRDWFMYEDQTIGLPQITKLYYDGYSKDYINKMIDKVSSISYEDYEKKYGEDSSAKFFVDQTDWQKQNKKFVEALFDPDYNAKDQKIGSSPKEAKKLAKEAEKIEDSFYERTDWPNKGDKALSYNKVEDWLDKPENKEMVDEYNKIWEETCGKKSKEINDLFEEYDNNWRDWRAKAGIYRALTDTTSNKTLGEIGWMMNWYAFDDGDQTEGNSNGMYLSEKGYNNKDINKMFFEARESFDAAEQIAGLIPKYNPKINNMSDKAQNKINEVLNDKMLKKHDYSIYKLTEASDAGDFDKNDLREANKVFNNFKIPKPKNNPNGTKLSGWWFVNEAINNLDMASINYKDLTSSDWNKINNEITKLTDEYNSKK